MCEEIEVGARVFEFDRNFLVERFLPQQILPLTRRSPSPLHSPVFFSPVSFACLATLRVGFLRY
jgi:hypothetical protein